MNVRQARWSAGAVVGCLVALLCVGTPRPVRATPDDAPGPTDVSDAASTVGLQPAVRVTGLRSFTVAATGDILTENAVLATGAAAAAGTSARYDFDPIFAPTTPIISSATLAICHMETPIGEAGARAGLYGTSPFGGNRLLSPIEIAPAIANAGFDRCTTSSNHSNDLGVPGIDSTLEALDAVGVGHVGTARTQDEATTQLITVNGVRVAHLGYTVGSNTEPTPEPWQLNVASSVGTVVDAVNAARAQGAEVVILSLHLLHEKNLEPIASDRQFVTAITALTHIDLVIEHGPHVVQPIEDVNGTWVYWSVGNFVSGMGSYGDTIPAQLDGLIAWARFDEISPGVFAVTPSSVLICNEATSRVVYPAITTLADPTISASLRRQLEACVSRDIQRVPDAS